MWKESELQRSKTRNYQQTSRSLQELIANIEKQPEIKANVQPPGINSS